MGTSVVEETSQWWLLPADDAVRLLAAAQELSQLRDLPGVMAIVRRHARELMRADGERKMMIEAFYWKARRHVDRIIFCSTPFQGSTWAASWIGSFGSLFVAQSHGFTDFFDEVERKNPGMWKPDFNTPSSGTVNSVMSLKPKQRSMDIFRSLPIVPTTATHVIKGSHDIFVSPQSSDCPGAESTLTVPSGHGSFHHPQAIAEIKRILALPPHH